RNNKAALGNFLLEAAFVLSGSDSCPSILISMFL
ncbi:MAG: hypothetical protein ACI97N_000843, partial [Cognaticolwellia sp.]